MSGGKKNYPKANEEAALLAAQSGFDPSMPINPAAYGAQVPPGLDPALALQQPVAAPPAGYMPAAAVSAEPALTTADRVQLGTSMIASGDLGSAVEQAAGRPYRGPIAG
jgi:hypothetical protein